MWQIKEGGGGVKNRLWMTSFMDGPLFCLFLKLALTECMMKGDKKETVIPAALATATPRTLTTVGNIS